MNPKREAKKLFAAAVRIFRRALRYRKEPNQFDALLSLAGSGRDLWANEHADEYVNRLREDWE